MKLEQDKIFDNHAQGCSSETKKKKKKWEEVINTNFCTALCPAQRRINSVSWEGDHQSYRAAVLTGIHLTLMIHRSRLFRGMLIECVVRALLETF